MKFHPVADIFPLMTEREFAELCVDIKANGLQERIWTFEDTIIDGRNRYNACIAAGVEPEFRPWPGEKEKLTSFVVSLNLNRRHLNESQRAMVAARLANTKQGERSDLSAIAEKLSQADTARLLNVSQDSVGRAVKVKEKGITALVEMVEAGEIPVSRAAAIAGLSKKKQHRIIKKGRDAGKKMITKLRAKALRNTQDGFVSCLTCNPEAKWTDETVLAQLEKLIARALEAKRTGRAAGDYGPIFQDPIEELAQQRLSEAYLGNREKILAAIDDGCENGDIGVREKTELQRVTKISWPEFNIAISSLLDYHEIEAFSQGRMTHGQRGAAKTLYRRTAKPASERTVELDDDAAEKAEIFNPFSI